MKLTLSHKSPLVLSLMILSACSSAPKNNINAEMNAPEVVTDQLTIEQILTDRVIAQIVQGAVEVAGKEGLLRLLNNAGTVTARKAISNQIQQAAIANGIKYVSVTKLTPAQASKVHATLLNLNPSLASSSVTATDTQAIAAAQQNSSVVVNSNVKTTDGTVIANAKNLYQGFGKGAQAKEAVNSFLAVKNNTNLDLVTKETCTVYPGKLDATAGKNVLIYWKDQAELARIIGKQSGLTLSAKQECMIKSGAARSIGFFANKLNAPQSQLAKTIETASIECKIVPAEFVAPAKQLLAQNSMSEIAQISQGQCN